MNRQITSLSLPETEILPRFSGANELSQRGKRSPVRVLARISHSISKNAVLLNKANAGPGLCSPFQPFSHNYFTTSVFLFAERGP